MRRCLGAGHPFNPSRKFNMRIQHRFSILLLAAAAFTTLGGCASSATQESTGQYMDDTAITAKVKTAIFNEETLKSAEINVETFKGAVQLSGFVGTQSDINKAVAVTKAVSGVRSVKNDMRLK
jgi:osmotically-inducible protein OsmY